MKLVPKEKKKEEDKKGSFQISVPKQKLIGVETSKVVRKQLHKTIQFAGTVAYDPELYTALVEYREILRQSGISGIHENSGSLIYSAKNRLLQMGLSEEGIRFHANRNSQELLTGGKDGNSIIYAAIYESEIGSIKQDMELIVKSNSYPNQKFIGKIMSIDSVLDPTTRTLRARVLVKDPQKLLKPQMLVNVELDLKKQNILSVPSSAIMHTGVRTIVYKKMGEDNFQKQVVLTGLEGDEFTEITKGLEEGDEVVTGANFLVDSESKLQFGNKEIPND
jgi:Cu(I)/Ag(I) efflux system membrane fusion protein